MWDKLTPALALYERDALLMAISLPGNIDLVPNARENELQATIGHLLPNLKSTIAQSEIIVWDAEMYYAAISGAEVFKDSPVPSEFFTGPSHIWFFSKDCNAPDIACKNFGLEGRWLVSAIVFQRNTVPDLPLKMLQTPGLPLDIKENWLRIYENKGKRAVNIHLLFSRSEEWILEHRNDPYLPPTTNLFPLTPIIEGEICTENLVCGFIGSYLFMNGTIAEAKEYSPNHQTRKKYKKEGRTVPIVRAVVLRRRERDASNSDMHSDVEWSCQWFVRGHWRKLHEPRKSDGATVTYVQPYIKGPEDKPLKPPAETIFTVNR